MTVDDTFHEKKANLMRKGAGGGPLRQVLRPRFGEICHQTSTKDSKMEGRAEFKSDYYYKIPRDSVQAALGLLRIEVEQRSDSSINTMSRIRVRIMGGSQESQMTQEEPGEATGALEVPKSPRTPRP